MKIDENLLLIQEDQATNELQDRIAKLAGKEAGLFCVSGTMVSLAHLYSHSPLIILTFFLPFRPINSLSVPTSSNLLTRSFSTLDLTFTSTKLEVSPCILKLVLTQYPPKTVTT